MRLFGYPYNDLVICKDSPDYLRSNPANQIRRNNRLFKSRKKSQKHRSNFLKNRRNLQKQMRQARWDHINGIITQEGNKARKGFWRYVKQFKKDNTGITVLKKDGRSATSPQQKAEMLNAQFSSVFTEEDTENLPQLNKQYQGVCLTVARSPVASAYRLGLVERPSPLARRASDHDIRFLQ